MILGYNICAADTEEEALLLRSSGLQAFLNLRQGNPGPLPKPNENFEESLSDADRHSAASQPSFSRRHGKIQYATKFGNF